MKKIEEWVRNRQAKVKTRENDRLKTRVKGSVKRNMKGGSWKKEKR